MNVACHEHQKFGAVWVEAFLTLVRERFGQLVPTRRHDSFRRAVIEAYVASGARSLDEYHALVSTESLESPHVAELMSRLTVKESYFFRDEFAMTALSDIVLPKLLDLCGGERDLAIWSAGASNGEEAYTLSLLIDRLPRGARATIVGTDVDETALATARAARYTEWSVRTLSADVRTRYFEAKGGKLELGQRYRRRVRFEAHNLADAGSALPEPGQFDLVLCRNVGIYLSDAALDTLYTKLAKSLRPGGLLVTAPSDPRPSSDGPLRPVLLRTGSAVVLAYSTTPAVWDASATAGAEPPARRNPPSTIPAAPPASTVPTPLIPPPPKAFTLPLAEEGSGAEPPRGEDPVEEALALAGAGKLEEAWRAIERAVAASPLDARRYVALSMVELERNRHAAAETALKKALYLDPNLAEAHYRLGLLFARRGDFAAARRALLGAVRTSEVAGIDPAMAASIGAQLARLERLV